MKIELLMSIVIKVMQIGMLTWVWLSAMTMQSLEERRSLVITAFVVLYSLNLLNSFHITLDHL